MSRTPMEFLDFPNELLIHIICFADVVTINILSRSCKKLKNCCDSKTVWKYKWKQLTAQCPLDFSSFNENAYYGENLYKSMYKRLWCVWFSKCTSEGLLLNLVACFECKQLTCAENCSQLCHIALDIGSSTTRIATEMPDGSFNYSHHPTTVGLVKKRADTSTCSYSHYGPEANNDVSFERNGIPIPRYSQQTKRSVFSHGMAHSMPGHGTNCTPNLLSSSLPCGETLQHKLNALDILQQRNSFHDDHLPDNAMTTDVVQHLDNDKFKEEWHIVCLVCGILKKENRSRNRRFQNDRSFTPSYGSCHCMCHLRNKQDTSHRGHWYCYESAFRNMFRKNCMSVSPLEAITKNNILSCMEFHITHILKIYLPHVDLHRPNVTAVFCEPWNATPELRMKIAEIMFERIKVPRLLFVNKAVAASYLKNNHTCIVIDSGCFNTVTSIIVDHQVNPDLIHHSPFGGNTVTEHLLENIQMNYPNEHFDIVSLDRIQVKNSCHIPYLLSLDEKRQYECKVKVKSCCSQNYSYFNIGAAHYLAPELMYSALDLPGTIKRLTANLNPSLVQSLLKHIIMIGGNSKLEGFSQRLAKDIRDTFPIYRDFVNVQGSYRADRVDAIHGALLYSQSSSSSPDGAVSREQYIFHGPEIFNNANCSLKDSQNGVYLRPS